VAGESSIAGGSGVRRSYHAVRWSRSGVITDLGASTTDSVSQAAAINDEGAVVGNQDYIAALWEPGGAVTDLGTLPNGSLSAATAINNEGTIVGFSNKTPGYSNRRPNSAGTIHAAVWRTGSD